MPKYRTTFDTPENFSDLFRIIQSYATILDVNETTITIELEEPDDYELAITVHDLQDEIRGYDMGWTDITFKRPKKHP